MFVGEGDGGRVYTCAVEHRKEIALTQEQDIRIEVASAYCNKMMVLLDLVDACHSAFRVNDLESILFIL
jgi:hypothetical protein